MKCELCFDDWLDLPSLTQIQCSGRDIMIFSYIGNVILESMLSLTLFDY